jgi:tetratricopeptide (TPR) repeat protein
MSTIYCGNCGAAMRATANFCRQCGAKLAAQDVEPLPAELAPSAPLPEVVSGAAVKAVRSESAAEPQATVAAALVAAAPPAPTTPSAAAEHKKRPRVASYLTRAWDQARAQFQRLGRGSREPSVSRPSPKQDGAARALARASGLTAQRPFGSALRIAGLALVILLAGSAYLAYRNQNPSSLRADRSGLNLVAPDEKSNQYVALGERDREQGRYEAAIEDFKQAIALNPHNTRAYFFLAKAYKASGRLDEALTAYAQVLAIDEKNLEARLQLAEIYRERGMWREALQEYQRIIVFDQSSEQAIVALEAMETYAAERAANYAPLRSARRPAKRQPPSLWLPAGGEGAHLHLPLPELTLGALGRQPVPDSGNPAEEMMSARALAEDHKRKGQRFLNIGQHMAAIKEFQVALNLTPEDKDLHYLLGSAYQGNGQPALAYEHYKKCDSGNYAQVALSGAKNAEKEMRKEAKREEAQKKKERSSEAGKTTPHDLLRTLN